MDTGFTINADLKQILDDWKPHDPIKLNIFRLVSDVYHRECLHSDVIGKLLEPQTHAASMRLFIQLLNVLKPELKLNPDDYANAQVKREPGKIDLFIQSSDSNRCIIFENKINDADDTGEQLSRYLTTVQGWLCKPEAIVYLSKDGTKEPSERTFNINNKAGVEKLLVRVAAFTDKETDLVNGWLCPLLKESDKDKDNELSHLIKQYIDILKEIGKHMMNRETQNEFMAWLKQTASNLEYAKRCADLYSNRIYFALREIADKYNAESVRKKYDISKAEARPSNRGWAQIQVKTGSNYTVQLWIQEMNGGIELTVFKLINDRSQPMDELPKREIASNASPGADGVSRFRWPEDAAELDATIERLLEFLHGPKVVDAIP